MSAITTRHITLVSQKDTPLDMKKDVAKDGGRAGQMQEEENNGTNLFLAFI